MIGNNRYGSMASAMMRRRTPSFRPMQNNRYSQPQGMFGMQQPFTSPGFQSPAPTEQPQFTNPVQPVQSQPAPAAPAPPPPPAPHVTPFAGQPQHEFTSPGFVQQPAPAPSGVTPVRWAKGQEFRLA